MTALDVAVLVLGVVSVLGALFAVSVTRVVHAALWLVVAVVSAAGVILVLGGELVGLSYVLIYVGAIVILVLFALMLTRAPMGPDTAHEAGSSRIASSTLAGAATSALLLLVLLPVAGWSTQERQVADTAAVARRIFGTWVWPFELLSLLLLVALVAALALSRLGVPDREGARR